MVLDFLLVLVLVLYSLHFPSLFTASPISAGDDDLGAAAGPELKKNTQTLRTLLRGHRTHF